MCLVISVLLGALGINFYLNGFYMQAALMAVLSSTLIVFMIRNISCRQNSCGIKSGKHKEDEKNDPDSPDHTHLDQQKAENK